ncbi:uncharacterized protein LOC115328912 [Ixodes scapularis]|uniref:uncharacterized protein LOC115328912 n=1 Tax=Ixodes scapularis TaxID=6945 RepID=UPI001A9DA3C0|nr:uncharacterized protein LOC115328912 [Ixodes scapularis]
MKGIRPSANCDVVLLQSLAPPRLDLSAGSVSKSNRSSPASSTEGAATSATANDPNPNSAADEENATAAPSSAGSSIVSPFEDLRAPLLVASPSASPRRKSFATRLRRLGRLSFSGGSTEGSSPEKAASGVATTSSGATPPRPSKGILRRRKVHCSKREPAASFGTESSTEEGSPERRRGGRFCKRALGRVFRLGSAGPRRHDGEDATEGEGDVEEERRVPKSVSIEEPEKSPSRRQEGARRSDAWKRKRVKKPPLVFGGTFPIDEPVATAPRSAVGRAAVESLSVATFPVDAFCCAMPNLCEGHARRATAGRALERRATVGASASESEDPEGRGYVASVARPASAGGGEAPAPKDAAGTRRRKGPAWLRLFGNDTKVHEC